MGLVKKHYQKIIVYGLIIISILLIVATLIIHPKKVSIQEAFHFDTNSKLTEIPFPYSINVPISSETDYVELYYGDDSINNYSYTISAFRESDLLFKHKYENETSNIIRIPLGGIDLNPEDSINIQISCNETCKDVYFKLYDIDGKNIPKIAIASYKPDYYYLWFAVLLLTIDFIIMPLIKDNKK